MATIGSNSPYRGILRPEERTENAIQCMACQGWFIPDESNFGCPGCAQQRELLTTIKNLPDLIADAEPPEYAQNCPNMPTGGRALLIKRFSRFELKDLGYDE